MVDGSTADHSLDVRLDRRLKRRIVSNHQCKNFYRNNVNGGELEEECDAEYRKFLSSLPEFVDSSDGNFGHYTDDNGISQCDWSDEKVDPAYRVFFQHLFEDGKSFKLEIPSVNGIKVYVKYEEEEEQSRPNNDQNSQKLQTTRILRSAIKPKSNHGVNENSSTMPGTGLLRSVNRCSRSDCDSDLVDEDYKTFLTGFVYDDDQRLIYMSADGRSFVYDDNGSTTDSEVVMMDSDPCTPSHASFGRKYFRPTMDVDSGKCLQSPGICKSSNFRERLIKVLKRPYDQNEYDFFLEEVGRRRAHVRHRELRSGVLRAYTLESRGKSYLHLYGELAMRIQSVQYDRSRTLNLLRGFFYWLQNLSHEDAFQPWMDPSCLDVSPRS